MSDRELELVLEYSRFVLNFFSSFYFSFKNFFRQTYLKELAERKKEEKSQEEDVDLLIIENPEVLEQDRKIKQIKQMLCAKKE